MVSPQAIGYIAGAITWSSFIPPIVTAHKTKSAKHIDILPIVMIALSSILWIIHHKMIHNKSGMYVAASYLVMIAFIVIVKIYFDRIEKKIENKNPPSFQPQ